MLQELISKSRSSLYDLTLEQSGELKVQVLHPTLKVNGIPCISTWPASTYHTSGRSCSYNQEQGWRRNDVQGVIPPLL
jgi:hypothetical protein